MSDDKDPKIEVTSYNQSGGITAQSVVIVNNPAIPTPVFTVNISYVNQRNNQVFLSRIQLSIITPYPIGNLYIAIHAPTIQQMEVNPMRSGLFVTGHGGKRDGFIFTNIPGAFGNYQIDLTTSSEEKFEIEYSIQ